MRSPTVFDGTSAGCAMRPTGVLERSLGVLSTLCDPMKHDICSRRARYVIASRTLFERNPSSFTSDVEPVGREPRRGLRLSVRPANHEPIDLTRAAKTEVHAKIVLRQVAAAAAYFSRLLRAAGVDRDLGADRVAIALS